MAGACLLLRRSVGRILKKYFFCNKKCCFLPLRDDLFLTQFQTGEYFGATVCAMDVNDDSFTDLILISAPMYKENDREGRVYVCRLTGLVKDSFI